jgi:hypothetical protein
MSCQIGRRVSVGGTSGTIIDSLAEDVYTFLILLDTGRYAVEDCHNVTFMG